MRWRGPRIVPALPEDHLIAIVDVLGSVGRASTCMQRASNHRVMGSEQKWPMVLKFFKCESWGCLLYNK